MELWEEESIERPNGVCWDRSELMKCKAEVLQLHYAYCCEYGHLNLVKWLVYHPTMRQKIMEADREKEGFRQACVGNRLNVVQWLLTNPMMAPYHSVHYKDDFALKISCKFGYKELALFLLNSDLLVDHANVMAENGRALLYAVEGKSLEIVQLLLENPTWNCFTESNMNSAFEIACSLGDVPMVDYLLNSTLIKKNAKVSFAEGRPLKIACHYGHTKVVKFLLDSQNTKTSIYIPEDIKKTWDREDSEWNPCHELCAQEFERRKISGEMKQLNEEISGYVSVLAFPNIRSRF